MNCNVVLILLILIQAAVYADVVYLIDGGRLEGIVEENDDTLTIRADSGIVTVVRKDDVKERVEKLTKAQEYAELLALTPDDNPEALLSLAKWCAENKMQKHARELWKRIIELEQNHIEARRKLGYAMVDGKWITREEKLKLDGKILSPRGGYRSVEEVLQEKMTAERKLKAQRDLNRTKELLSSMAAIPFNDRKLSIEQLSDYTIRITMARDELYGLDNRAKEWMIQKLPFSHQRAQELILRVFAMHDDQKTLMAMLNFLQKTPSEPLAELCAIMITKRSDKRMMIEQALKVANFAADEKVRRRAQIILLIVADKAIINTLIPNTAWSPIAVPIDQNAERDRLIREYMRKNSTKTNDINTLSREALTYAEEQLSELRKNDESNSFSDENIVPSEQHNGYQMTQGTKSDIKKEPYFPIAETLRYLTRVELSPDQEAWQRWWTRNAEHFRFHSFEPQYSAWFYPIPEPALESDDSD